jgi:hypothetical protein
MLLRVLVLASGVPVPKRRECRLGQFFGQPVDGSHRSRQPDAGRIA